jgi:predicted dithiol-disulfide oxidoreductase (DUF899 family)
MTNGENAGGPDYQWLDRAPLGRNENEPGLWWKRRDEY